MQQQDKASSPESQSTVRTCSPASPEEEAGSSSDSVARCLPSPLAQLAGQDHPQSGDADDVTSHAAQLASTSKDSSPDPAAQKGMPSCALPCFALSRLALLPCLPPALALALAPAVAMPLPEVQLSNRDLCARLTIAYSMCLTLLDGQLTVTQHTPHEGSHPSPCSWHGRVPARGWGNAKGGVGGRGRGVEGLLKRSLLCSFAAMR